MRYKPTRRRDDAPAKELPPDPVLTEKNKFVSARETHPSEYADWLERAQRAVMMGRYVVPFEEWKGRGV